MARKIGVHSISCVVVCERAHAKELSAKLVTAFICDFYSGVQRGQSVSVFFALLVVFVLSFNRLLLRVSYARLFLVSLCNNYCFSLVSFSVA